MGKVLMSRTADRQIENMIFFYQTPRNGSLILTSVTLPFSIPIVKVQSPCTRYSMYPLPVTLSTCSVYASPNNFFTCSRGILLKVSLLTKAADILNGLYSD